MEKVSRRRSDHSLHQAIVRDKRCKVSLAFAKIETAKRDVPLSIAPRSIGKFKLRNSFQKSLVKLRLRENRIPLTH